MFIPSALVARSSGLGGPQACKPFSIHSNVCVGDMIAILACGVAGIGFFFWAIHALRKMRLFPFNHKPECKEKLSEKNERIDHYHVPSASEGVPPIQRSAVRTPSVPHRARTRLASSGPGETFYRSSTPIRSDTYYAQGPMITPRTPRPPPHAGGQFGRTSSHRSGHHGSTTWGGAYGENYGPHGATSKYVRGASPSRARARGPPLHRSGSSYASYQSSRDPMMYMY